MLEDKRAFFTDRLSEITDQKNIYPDEPLARHTSFRIGGPCDFFVYVEDEKELAEVVSLCKKEDVRFCMIGNGTNVLAADQGFDGVVIRLAGSFTALSIEEDINEGTAIITAGAGVALTQLAMYALKKGFTGLEFAHGIPGTVGGGVLMNAGAYGSEIKDVIVGAKALDSELRPVTIKTEEMDLGYRRSVFADNGSIITEASFKLRVYPRIPIRTVMEGFKHARMQKQPLDVPSAGSTFKRPEGFFAGKLIEDSGLKGFRIGDAAVSEKHAGFVVNLGNATAKDVCAVIDHVREVVKDRFGVDLETEIRYIG